jgi:acyl-CoA synthetase (NDP forming)
MARHAGIGFTRFVSLGNQADLNAAQCLQSLISHEPTRAIAVYVEDFGDGRAFAAVAEEAVAAGKPVILLTVGSTTASVRTARSHTGALVSDSLAVDAACRASGMYRVDTPQQMVDLAQVLLMPRPLSGRRMGIVGDGGGHVALAADRLIAHGLSVDPFSRSLHEKLAGALPATAITTNPVDIAGGGEEDIWNFERAVRLMAESGEVDAVLLTGYFGGYSEQLEPYAKQELEVAESMVQVTAATASPLVVQTMYPASPTSLQLRRAGIPVYADIEAAALALGRCANHLPPTRVVPFPNREARSQGIPPPRREGRLGTGDYFSARRLLESAGVPFVEARPAAAEQEAIAAARAIGYPVVLKGLGSSHKSDDGGVRLAIASDDALISAFRDMKSRLNPGEFSIEREAPIEQGVELLVGVKRDRSFGPIALVGLGGLHAELFRDMAVALAPLREDQAVALIKSLDGAQLLTGWRGRPRLDIDSAARVLTALSELAASDPSIVELEINPLLVLNDAVLALDARISGFAHEAVAQ